MCFFATPLGTKFPICHFVGDCILEAIGNIVNLATCAEIM